MVIPKALFSFFLILILVLFSKVKAQQDIEGFQHVLLTNEGDPISDITDIVQDAKGYIWIGTDQGLFKLRGNSYDVYRHDPEDATSLQQNHITALLTDKEGVLWVGTKNGLFQYKEECDCFNTPLSANGNESNNRYVSDLEIDVDGNVWIAFYETGILKYDILQKKLIPFFTHPVAGVDLSKDVISDLLIKDENQIWIATGKGYYGNGLIRFDPSEMSATRFIHQANNNNSLIDNRISSLMTDNNGRLFAASYKCGLHLFDQENNQFEVLSGDTGEGLQLNAPYSDQMVSIYGDIHNDSYVAILFQDSQDGYWIGTPGKGLYYFPDASSKPIPLFFDLEGTDKPPNNIFKCIFEDKQGVLWIGCEGGDLYRKDLYAPNFQYYPDTFGSEIVYQSPFQPQFLWAGSESGGLRQLDLSSGKLTTYKHDPKNVYSIRHNSIRNVYQESPDVLWVGAGSIGGIDGGEDGLGGLERLDLKTGKFRHYDISPPEGNNNFSHTVYNIMEDEKGRLWCTTGRGGIYRSDTSKTLFQPFPIVLEGHSTKESIIYDLGLLDDKRIWISGVFEKGRNDILVFDSSKEEFSYLFDEDVGLVTNIVEVSEGEFWLSTWSHGIKKYNASGQLLREVTVKDGLPSNYACYLVQGENQDLWIGTRYGVCRMDLSTEKIERLKINSNWFYFGITRINDGRIFISTRNKGLASFRPDEIAGNPFAPETKITKITVSGKELSLKNDEPLRLNYASNNINFDFDGLHFSNPEKNQFAYMLHPVNDHWVEIGNEQRIRFENLRPGDYSFSVKSSNNVGVWSQPTEAIEFQILKPIWLTGWAFLMYVLFLTSVIYIIYRFILKHRLAKQEAHRLYELDAFKDKFYTNITHEFRTPLTIIEGMADEIGRNPNKDPQKSVILIKKNSKKLLSLINQILDLSKLNAGKIKLSKKQFDVVTHLRYLVEMYSSHANSKGVNLQFHSEEDSIFMDTDLGLLEQAIVNIVSNAIKFTPQYGKVLLSVRRKNDGQSSLLHIKIKDTGYGIAQEELPKIFDRYYQASHLEKELEGTGIGLALAKEIVELLDGLIEVTSTLDQGTTFHIYLPITNELPKAHNESSLLQIDEDKITATPEESYTNVPLILIIEDNGDVVEYLKLILESSFRVVSAFNGKDGLELAIQTQPDIVISDVMMPGMDGYEVCSRLKEHPSTDHIPVILLTARVSKEDRLQGLLQGADAYLAKPFERDELLIRVNKLLELRDTLRKKYSTALSTNFSPISLEEEKIHAFIEKVEQIVLNHLDNESFDYDTLASEVFLSRSQLNRKIKSLTGMSTSIYVRSVRLHKAKEFLKNTDMNVTQVSYAVGFNSPVYFSQAFKDYFGIPPSQFL